MNAQGFWAKVRKTGTCWLWTGAINSCGRGSLNWEGRSKSAHHVGFYLAHGRWPAVRPMEILHSCDVPTCVNPAHLREGTRAENMQDMVSRGRHLAGRRRFAEKTRGERHCRAKLTNDQVLEIAFLLSQGHLQRVIAAEFGISREAVTRIKNGRNWKHLDIGSTRKLG